MLGHRGILRISENQLREYLQLEDDIEILDARINFFNGGGIDLVVSGKSVPECPEGAYPIVSDLVSFQRGLNGSSL